MTDTTTPTPDHAPPVGLGERGTRFWTATRSRFDLSDLELEVLAEACRTLDVLDALAAAVREHGSMVAGSQGQPVVNPAITEARGQRLALHRLLAALNLPDDDGATLPTARQVAASTAAAARWAGHELVEG